MVQADGVANCGWLIATGSTVRESRIAAGRIEIAVRQLWTCLRFSGDVEIAVPHLQAIQSGLTEFILMTIQIAKQAVFQAFSASFFAEKFARQSP